jgi:hypothetical protein
MANAWSLRLFRKSRDYFVNSELPGFFVSLLWRRFCARFADSIASWSMRLRGFSAELVAFPPVDSSASWEGLAGVFVESKPLAILLTSLAIKMEHALMGLPPRLAMVR